MVTASNLRYIVVTFDENMMTSGPSSVTNPQNWALLENGSQVVGGIQQIYFGLNEAAMLSQTRSTQTSACQPRAATSIEAVLMLNGSGAIDPATGLRRCRSGNITITALNSLRDVAGNPLGRTGYTPQGYAISRKFDLLAPTGAQTQVSGSAGAPPAATTTSAGAASPQASRLR